MITNPQQRRLAVQVFGDFADEIEKAASDAAAAFFGNTNARMLDYTAEPVSADDEPRAGGKFYTATVHFVTKWQEHDDV